MKNQRTAFVLLLASLASGACGESQSPRPKFSLEQERLAYAEFEYTQGFERLRAEAAKLSAPLGAYKKDDVTTHTLDGTKHKTSTVVLLMEDAVASLLVVGIGNQRIASPGTWTKRGDRIRIEITESGRKFTYPAKLEQGRLVLWPDRKPHPGRLRPGPLVLTRQ